MKRGLLLLATLAVATGAGVVSIDRARDQLAVIEACEAAQAGDLTRALELTAQRTGPDDTGRAAAECRCRALLDAGDAPACLALLDALVDDPESWTPEPRLAALLVGHRSDAGREAEAAALAHAAARAHPEDPHLFELELETRAVLEPEADVLRDLAARVPAGGEAAARMRVVLGQRHLLRGDPPAALRALGPQLPDGAARARSLWFDTLGIAHAMNDDAAAARASYARWEREGGRPEEVRARYALALSVSGLADPERDMPALLRAALADAAGLGDPKLEQTLAIRLIFTLVAAERFDEAIEAYDALSPRISLGEVRREELVRARRGDALARDPAAVRAGRLRFTAGPGAADGELWISPGPGAEPDADYERHALAAGTPVEVERTVDIAPVRWVWRAPEGAVRASGAIYPRAGETRSVKLRPRDPAAPAPSQEIRAPGARAGAPADGRRRVALVLLDCGDWSLTQYLRTRGELPVLDALLREGHRAVLDSDPPLTAAALEALVWPARRSDVSVVGTFYRFGVEMAGLESVGANPFELLSWVLPETQDLFAKLGAGERSAANLLLAHGGVRAGRHGEVTGPGGRTRRLSLGRSRRALDAQELRRFPGLAGLDDALDVHQVHTIAAEFDATEQLLRDGAIDLVAVRIEPLDILTHAHFAEAVREGPDDGRGLLFEVYRYVDARIGAVRGLLDGDDVLIVLSDHGIRTALEHARPAIFVAHGPDVPRGRAPGRPALRGVARVLADLLGVATAWPETGVASWASAVAAAPEGPRAAD